MIAWNVLRDRARQAVLDRDWEDAADFLQLAIERYPRESTTEIIRKNDIARMTRDMVLYRDLQEIDGE